MGSQMKNALGLFGVISLLISLATCTIGKSAIQEIEGLIWLLIAVIFFVGAAILSALAGNKQSH